MRNSYIGLMAYDSPELLMGLLGIVKSGNTFVPINPHFPNHRIQFIIDDCQIPVLLTDKANYDKASQIAAHTPIVKHVLCIDDLSGKETPGAPAKERDHGRTASQNCYVIYTSGSTGKPKGVPITHRNLVPLFYWFRDYFRLGEHTRVLQNLSYTFDFGVFEILSTLLFGGCMVVIDKRTAADFTVYVDFIDTYRVNTLHTTPVFFSNITNSGRELPGLKILHLGGERLTGKILKKIHKIVSRDCIVYNGYGPTEATINCSIFAAAAEERALVDESSDIPIGRPSADNEIYILDKHHNPQPIGAAGELCVAGPGLAEGYLNRPELTAERFPPAGAPLRFSASQLLSFSLYHTGDLARWLPDGNIEFLGRIDHQVKIRGFRIELGEIESRLFRHPDIKEAVVFARESERGGHYLCAYIVARSMEHGAWRNMTELREFLAKELPDYMIPSYFIPLQRLPMTPNGKIDRKALPLPEKTVIETGQEYAAPVTGVQKKLVSIWQGLLNVEQIGINHDFFELGGDSILVSLCIARIREELQVEIPVRSFFERPYIKALSETTASRGLHETSIPKAPRDREIPLSFAQERLWFLQELDSGSTAYFVPRVIRIKGELDINMMERTFTGIIKRHEILRTVFPTKDGLPVQRILPPYPFTIPVFDWSREKKAHQAQRVKQFLEEEGQRPFDFEKGPLLRVTLIKLKEEDHLLILTEHHLIHDGWTQGVLLKEFIVIFTAFSEGEPCPLPDLPIQYADFAVWQREFLQGEVLEHHLDYWRKKLAGSTPVLDLPTDRPRPSAISGKGAMKPFHLSGSFTRQLKDFSKKNNVTLFMSMLAVFKTFLYRYTGVEDLCVGTGTANRRYKEMEGMLGMVINTLPLRTRLDGNITFNHCLQRVKETCLEAYQHEDTPFGKIVEMIQPERSLSYMPIFQVMFSFMDTPGENLRLPGLELHLEEFHNRSSKFDINIVVVPPQEQVESEGETLIEWEYNTDIFDDETADRMIKHYTRLLEQAVVKPAENISALPMLSNAEVEQLLYEWNNTGTDYPAEKTIDQLFDAQVEKRADRIAVISRAVIMTYSELSRRAGQLAHLLQEKGVTINTIVGIKGERSIEMMVGTIGILKAGGAYLPIDPDYPEERITYMLRDSGARILLTKVSRDIEVIDLIKNIGPIGPIGPMKHSLCYVMYTSGSTGRPKGVMVTHRNVLRLVINTNYIRLSSETRILQTGAPVFDAATFEMWGSLLNGGQLVLVHKDVILDAHDLARALMDFNVNTLWLSSPLFNRLMQQNIALFSPLQYLLVGGDVLSPESINRVRETFPSLKIINGYGPTENTTFSTTFPVDKEYKDSIPIGSPIANSTAYIVDKYDHLVPIGVPGELHVGGDGVALGYLNNPEMTIEKFTNEVPFGPILNAFGEKQEKGTGQKKAPAGHPLSFSASQLLSFSLYRTGDLARRLPDGNIEFLGRKDFQVKIRGYRVELGEIESRLQTYPHINDAVLTAKEKTNGDKYLCAYFIPGQEVEITDVRAYLDRELPDYMIPTYFIPLDTFPLTANGKIDRKALPEPGIKKSEEYTAPSGEIEETLAGIWAEVLGVEKDVLGIDANFFDLGGHSLNAVMAVTRIHKAFHVKIPLGEFFKRGTNRELAQYIKDAVKEAFIPVEPVEKKEYYPLSPSQERLYLLHQMQPWSPAYNIPERLILTRDINEKSMEHILRTLIEHHESLRTGIKTVKHTPVQFIAETVDLPFRFYDISFMEETEKQQKRQELYHQVAAAPFDLGKFPLFRLAQVKLGPRQHELMFCLHHIITDGWSMEILKKEFFQLYESSAAGKSVELEPLHLQYKDFACWHFEQSAGKGKEENPAARFWKNKLAGGFPTLRLPADFPTAADEPGGAGYRCTINKELKEALLKLSAHHHTSLFTTMFSIYLALLSRVSGQKAVGCSVIAAGREHETLQDIVGLFVNSLLFGVQVDENLPFEEFLREVDADVMESLQYQGYPVEPVFEELGMRYPVISVSFNMLNLPGAAETGQSNPFKSFHIETAQDVKFDLEPYITEYGNHIDLRWIYRKALFKPLTIEYIANLYVELAAFFARDPRRSLKVYKTGAKKVKPGRFKRRKTIEE